MNRFWPVLAFGIALYHLLYTVLGIGYIPTLLIGMAVAAVLGHLHRARDKTDGPRNGDAGADADGSADGDG